MKTKLTLLALLSILLAACTSVKVQSMHPGTKPMRLVYIQQNPDSSDENILSVIENGLQRRGIQTKIITNERVPESAYVLTYTASNGWDLVSFLKHAELRLKEGNRLVGSAVYHHHGGYALTKYSSTESKITPVLNQLLSSVRTH